MDTVTAGLVFKPFLYGTLLLSMLEHRRSNFRKRYFHTIRKSPPIMPFSLSLMLDGHEANQ
jgi:hypothetical protein